MSREKVIPCFVDRGTAQGPFHLVLDSEQRDILGGMSQDPAFCGVSPEGRLHWTADEFGRVSCRRCISVANRLSKEGLLPGKIVKQGAAR